MKRLFTSALALFLLVGASQAQQTNETRHEKHHGQKEAVAQKLNLTEEQKAKLKSLHEQERAEMETLRKNNSLSATQKQEQRKAIQEKYKTQMRSILTPEQAKQMDEMRSSHAGKEGVEGRKHKGDRMAKGDRMDKGDRKDKLEKLGKELNITPEQRTQLMTIHSDFKSRREEIRNNSSLSQEEKQKQMKELAEAEKNKAKTVLTPEQQEKMKSLRKERKQRVKK